MTKNSTRVQLELPDASYQRLKKLQEKTEASSYAEVIRNALRLYEALVNEADAGNTVCVKHVDDTEVSYKMIF